MKNVRWTLQDPHVRAIRAFAIAHAIGERTKIALGAALLVTGLLLAAASRAQAVVADKPLSAAVARIVAPYLEHKDFMGTILIAKSGRVLLSEGYGYANVASRIPNTPQTTFHLGSLTKQFTAAGVLLLSERGLLSLDDAVNQYIPDPPTSWAHMTIRQLLTHTAGIHNFTDDQDFDRFSMVPITPSKWLERLRREPLDFKPGERFSYSNSGYILLGYLIEKLAGQSYGRFLQANVTDVLGMKNTGIYNREVVDPGQALGYQQNSRGIEPTVYEDPSVPFSAGSLYSTTGDLLRWEEGLMEQHLLREDTLQQMLTPSPSGYGLGLNITEEDGHRVIEHGGAIEGFSATLAYYPADRLVIAVLSNVSGSAPASMRPQLAAIARGQLPSYHPHD